MPAAALLCISCATCWRSAGARVSELARQGHSYLHSVVPWIVLLIGVAVAVSLGAGARDGGSEIGSALHAFVGGAVGCVFGLPGRDLCGAGVSRGACSRLAIRPGWRGFSDLAAGGRSLRRCAWAWFWRRFSTAPAGCWTRSPSDSLVRSPARAAPLQAASASSRCALPRLSPLAGVGRAAGLRARTSRPHRDRDALCPVVRSGGFGCPWLRESALADRRVCIWNGRRLSAPILGRVRRRTSGAAARSGPAQTRAGCTSAASVGSPPEFEENHQGEDQTFIV